MCGGKNIVFLKVLIFRAYGATLKVGGGGGVTSDSKWGGGGG